MALELTDLVRDPEHRTGIHIYNVDQEGYLSAGDRIRVQIKIGDDPVVDIADEVVPDGKVWKEIHFQFQALEDNI